MRFVFGDAFICEDSETAKRVAYDPRVRMRCITLDGDTYAPNGTLTGGNDDTPQGISILKRVREINRLEEELKFMEHRLSEHRQELASISARLNEQNDRQQKTEVLGHQLRLLRQRFDVDAKEAKSTRLKNLEEDLDEAR